WGCLLARLRSNRWTSQDQGRVEMERGLHVPFEPEVLHDFHHGVRSFSSGGQRAHTRTKERGGSLQSSTSKYLMRTCKTPPSSDMRLSSARSDCYRTIVLISLCM